MFLFTRHNNLSVTPILPLPAAGAWPSTLFIAPGNYGYPSMSFTVPFTEPGLVAMQAANGQTAGQFDSAHRVVWQTSWNTDLAKVQALLSALCWLTIYGMDDNALSDADKVTAARYRKLEMQCEATVNWIGARLTEQGLVWRKVRLLTGTTPNGWDEGHVIMEVKVGSQWLMFDPSTDALFGTPAAPLSLTAAMDAGIATVPVVALAPSEAGGGSWSGSRINPAIYFDQRLRYSVDAWRAEIFQIPGIDDPDGLTYFHLPPGTESRQTWLLGLSASYRVITKAAWLTRFYP